MCTRGISLKVNFQTIDWYACKTLWGYKQWIAALLFRYTVAKNLLKKSY
jgi:hypothetical protein